MRDKNIPVDNYCLIQKEILFCCKEYLQLVIKKYCVTEHYKIVVVESNQNIWYFKYKLVWQAKRKAIIVAFGDWEKSYNKFPYWLSAAIHYNPETRVDWYFFSSDVSGTIIFLGVFWSFGSIIEEFKYCSPLIQIDGTYLYGKYKGKMLTVLSIDVNGHIFPFAFAIFEDKNASS